MLLSPARLMPLSPRLIAVSLWRWGRGGRMWTRTSTCRPNGYRFTAPYPYEVTAGGAAAGELLRGVTGSRQILLATVAIRVGKGISIVDMFIIAHLK